MRLIGYSRQKLNTAPAVAELFAAVESTLGTKGYIFAKNAEQSSGNPRAFDKETAVRMLQESNIMGFYSKDAVGVTIDNQEFSNPSFSLLHAIVKIETMEQNGTTALGTDDWLSLAERLTESLQLELTIVTGKGENVADYKRTPLGASIGLIKVYWIMCFGEGYSRLTGPNEQPTAFTIRRESGKAGCKSFVSAPTYEGHRSASAELVARQRKEIGEDLFHRLPVEEKQAGAEAQWLLNPKVIFQLVAFLLKGRATDWHKRQARTVPEVYKNGSGVKVGKADGVSRQ